MPRDVVFDDVHISLIREDGSHIEVVRGVSMRLKSGKTVALVGESGAGKSVLGSSLIGLIPGNGYVSGGRIEVGGEDISTLPESEWKRRRGRDVAMIFQDPMTSLNPVKRVGSLVVRAIRNHESVSKKEARKRAIDILQAVGIPAPKERFSAYPHQLSGGLRQRVVIALALVNKPGIIIADEPTTALDTTVQAQILELLRSITTESTMIFVTHDLGVATDIAQEIVVLYGGEVMESGPIQKVLQRPRHHYTVGLINAAPRFTAAREPLVPIPGIPELPENLGQGCPFAPRCPAATQICRDQRPPLETDADDHAAACWHPVEEVDA